MSKPIAILLGLLYAALVIVLAFCFVGGGHGWLAPFWVSLLGFFIIPFAAVTYVRPQRSTLLGLLCLALLSDSVLILATAAEGFSYVRQSLRAVPFFVLSWIALWVLWQLALVIVYVRTHSIVGPNT